MTHDKDTVRNSIKSILAIKGPANKKYIADTLSGPYTIGINGGDLSEILILMVKRRELILEYNKGETLYRLSKR